jgi:hypothetical protein
LTGSSNTRPSEATFLNMSQNMYFATAGSSTRVVEGRADP